MLATKATASIESKRTFLAKYIGQGKITTSQQLDLALAYIKKNAALEINTEDFEKSCGVSIYKKSHFITFFPKVYNPKRIKVFN